MEEVSRAVQGDTRPTLPQSAPATYVQLMKGCWLTDRDARPTFTHIVDRLVDMKDALSIGLDSHSPEGEAVATTSC